MSRTHDTITEMVVGTFEDDFERQLNSRIGDMERSGVTIRNVQLSVAMGPDGPWYSALVVGDLRRQTTIDPNTGEIKYPRR